MGKGMSIVDRLRDAAIRQKCLRFSSSVTDFIDYSKLFYPDELEALADLVEAAEGLVLAIEGWQTLSIPAAKGKVVDALSRLEPEE